MFHLRHPPRANYSMMLTDRSALRNFSIFVLMVSAKASRLWWKLATIFEH
jgi:hypothetical protein